MYKKNTILKSIRVNLTLIKPSRFGSVVVHLDLDGEVSGSRWVIPKTLRMVLTAPQPVLVIMSLSKRGMPYTMDLQTKVV